MGIGIDDVGKVIDLVRQYGPLVEAFKGLQNIPAEVKDLNVDELTQLGAKVLEIVNKIKAVA